MVARPTAGQLPRARLAAGAAVVAALLAVGLLSLFRYVDQYVLYRGFGPPVSHVAPMARGRIVSFTFSSPALAGHRERPLVYLPAGYDTRPLQRYPVLYLLHGTPGDPKTAFVDSLHIAPRMDALVADHRVRPMIVVMPPGSGGTYEHATEWANGPGHGERWFRYLTHDLVHAVDRRFRAIPRRGDRAIAGYSSGADAAINAIIWHPGSYGVAEAWSGDFRQTPRTVDHVPALVEHFSALDTAAARATAIERAGDHVYLYAGADDPVLPMTLAVGHDLELGHVETRLDVTGGGHAWELWASRMDGALVYASDHMSPPR